MKPSLSPVCAHLLLARICTAIVATAAAAASASTVPDEIQVYGPEINAVGDFTAQLHLQMTPSTDPAGGEDGASLTRSWRSMLELAWGLAPGWEFGIHLPAARIEGASYLSAPKLRLKWLPLVPGAEGGFFAGVNVEAGHRQPKLDAGMNILGVRPIFGYQNPAWLVSVNPIVEWSVGGAERSRTPEFAPAAKITRTVATGLRTGAEFYADLGPLSRTLPASAQQQTLYWVIDVERGPLVMHLGIGRGLNRETAATTIKTVIQLPLP